MLELAVIPIMIILAIVYVWKKKAYASQIFTIIIFMITVYMYILLVTSHDSFLTGLRYPDPDSTYYKVLINSSFVPSRLFQIEYLPSMFTSMFLHISPMHLIGNLLFLYLLGLPLEERIGTKNWIIIFFLTGIGGTLAHYAIYSDSTVPALGVSGVIFGLGGALIVLYPRDKILMPIPLIFIMIFRRVQVWIAVGLMFGIETFITLLYPRDGVGHYAHLGGAITGIIVAPLIVKTVVEQRKTVLDIMVLRQLADSDQALEIVNKIEHETVKDVRDAWLEEFFKIVKCPSCGEQLEIANTVKCPCGQKFQLYR